MRMTNLTVPSEMLLTTATWTNSTSRTDSGWREVEYLAYGSTMFIILTLGLFGNLFTILVLSRREHRRKLIVPFVINLALADIFIVVFGYPVAISSNIFMEYGRLSPARCVWSAFVNTAVGITSIATYVVISILLCASITSKRPLTHRRLSLRYRYLLIVGVWLYGILSAAPPLFGWNRFVPGAAGISCCPDWTSREAGDVSYNLVLVFWGFFLPLSVIGICYFRIVRFFHAFRTTAQGHVKPSWLRYQRRIALMIGTSVAAFTLSWTPYCIVSIFATIEGKYILQAGAAEIPELLAKASVIYNPVVFTIVDSKFRWSLKDLLTCRLWRL